MNSSVWSAQGSKETNKFEILLGWFLQIFNSKKELEYYSVRTKQLLNKKVKIKQIFALKLKLELEIKIGYHSIWMSVKERVAL